MSFELPNASSYLDLAKNYVPGNGAGLVEFIRVETRFGPTITLQPGKKSQAAPGGLKDRVLQALQPKVTVKPWALQAQSFAPYGEPGPTQWPVVKTALFVGGGIGLILMAFGAASIIRR